jgi:CheY-like chemotaxis protein
MAQSASGKKLILIIEDALEIQTLLGRLLESEGYDTLRASNGQEALDILSASAKVPDLILLDLMMPVMDGFEFRKKQLQIPKFAGIRVVVMTADGNIEAKSKQVNANEFLRKPLDVDNLLDVIEKQVR